MADAVDKTTEIINQIFDKNSLNKVLDLKKFLAWVDARKTVIKQLDPIIQDIVFEEIEKRVKRFQDAQERGMTKPLSVKADNNDFETAIRRRIIEYTALASNAFSAAAPSDEVMKKTRDQLKTPPRTPSMADLTPEQRQQMKTPPRAPSMADLTPEQRQQMKTPPRAPSMANLTPEQGQQMRTPPRAPSMANLTPEQLQQMRTPPRAPSMADVSQPAKPESPPLRTQTSQVVKDTDLITGEFLKSVEAQIKSIKDKPIQRQSGESVRKLITNLFTNPQSQAQKNEKRLQDLNTFRMQILSLQSKVNNIDRVSDQDKDTLVKSLQEDVKKIQNSLAKLEKSSKIPNSENYKKGLENIASQLVSQEKKARPH